MLDLELKKRINFQGELSKTAIYDLGVMPTTFDFAAFSVIAKSLGAEEVAFIYNGYISQKKYPEDYAWRRWANICIPICRLAGLKYRLTPHSEGFTHWYHYGSVNAVSQVTEIKKLKLPESIGPQQGKYVTVTLRDSIRNKWRDSSLPDWKKFIEYLQKYHKVEILMDCEFAPMSIEYRMSLYTGAEMNFGASNGPKALCHFSDAPYITSNIIPRSGPDDVRERFIKYMSNGGFPIGSQFNFKNKDQLLVWEPDTYETLVKSYEQWRDENK